MTKLHFYSKRYREIVKVLFKHGFGFLIVKLGLGHLIPFHRGALGHRVQEKPYTRPEHLRAAFEELGTTFIKLGQILSTRADLLPQSYIEELSKLQSSVPPISFEEMEVCLKEELGEDWRSIFSHFELMPLASASVGQVYRANLPDGERIVVKVQRPGIENKIREDLEIILHIAQLAQQRLRLGEVVPFPELVQQFGVSLLKELDYIREGKNIERFKNNFQGSKKLYVPKVYWKLTTKRILAMEEITGFGIDDVNQLKDAQIDVKRLAKNCAENLIKMIFEDGFFHADPHPGNFFIRKDGTLALIDFGLVGELDEESRSKMISLFLALSQKDARGMADVLTSLDPDNHHVHHEELRRDIQSFFKQHFHETLSEINMSQAIQDLLDIIYQNKIRVPSHLSLLAKTIIMSEGIGRRLDPEFNLMQILREYAPRLYLHKLRTEQIGKKMKQTTLDLLMLSAEGPDLLLKTLRKASADQLEIQMNVKKVEPYIREFNRMFNRLSISMLTSAMIISLALLMLIYHPGSSGTSGNFGWLFTIGFILSLFFGGYVLISIWRSNKMK